MNRTSLFLSSIVLGATLLSASALACPVQDAIDQGVVELSRSTIDRTLNGAVALFARQRVESRSVKAIETLRSNPDAANVDIDALFKKYGASSKVAGGSKKAGGGSKKAVAGGRKAVAVLIAVRDYADSRIPTLTTPATDARSIGAALSDRFGFDVEILDNPRKEEVFKALISAGTSVAEDGRFVVHYGGHGFEIAETGMGYWLPADATADSPEGWISNDDISRVLAKSRGKKTLLVSDSCFAGTFAKDEPFTQANRPDLGSAGAARSVTVLTAGGEEPVFDGEEGGHSLFTRFLLPALSKVSGPNLGYDVYVGLRDAVASASPQTPRYGALSKAGHQSGDFVFEPR